VDTPVYEGYGLAMRHGIVPYRDIPIEYPPGALPAFVAPTFLGGYDTAFGWLMAACGAGCVVLTALAERHGFAFLYVAVSPLLVGSLVLTRFDLWPTLLAIGAVAAFVHDRHRLAWSALGAAIVVKLYALVVVPLAVVYTLRRRGRDEAVAAVVCGAVVVVAVLLPFAVAAPGGLWQSLREQLSRPLQIESLAASFVSTFGTPHVVSSHGSQNLAGEGAAAAAATAVEIAALVALWIAFARGNATPARLVRYAAACVCAFVALGKVLSPQYLIWLVPLVPLVRGRRGTAATALLTAALVATQAYFPQRYWGYVFHAHLAGLVLARNLLLVALLAVLSLPAPAPARTT